MPSDGHKAITGLLLLAPAITSTNNAAISPMKLDHSRLLKLAATGISGLAFSQALQAATVLAFDNQGPNNDTPPMPQSYGDNVTAADAFNGISVTAGVEGIIGTPDITLGYGPNPGPGDWDSYPDWDGRGPVLQSDFRTGDMALDFQPAPGTGVLVTSFDLDEYVGGGNSIIEWQIISVESNETLVSGTWNAFSTANDPNDAGGRSTVLTGMTVAQALANKGSVLTLLLHLVGGATNYQALDNLAFDQVGVPEQEDFAVLSIVKNGDQLTLTWESEAGQTFAVEESSDLGKLDAWTIVSGEGSIAAAAGGSTSRTFSVAGGGSTHFYRVVRP